MSESTLHRVVVLGAGFAGIRVARKLAKKAERHHLAVTLVDRAGVHAYTPSFYALAGTTADSVRHRHLERAAAFPLRRLVAGLPVSVVQAEVREIDTSLRRVALADGRFLRYDTLVICLGSETNYYDVPGLRESAHALKTVQDADAISRKLANLMRGRAEPIRVTVGGGGATGVELSAMLAETVAKTQAGAHVTLIEANDQVLPGFPDGTRTYVREELERREVRVRTGDAIAAAGERSVHLGSGEEVPHDLLVWTGGIQAPEVLSSLPYVLERGRIAVDAPLTCVPKEGGAPDPHVYALGDATYFHYKDGPAPWTAQVAIQQADTVATNVIRTLEKRRLKHFRVRGQSILFPLGNSGGAGLVAGFPIRGRVVQALVYLVEWRYLASLIPWEKALKLVSRRIG